MTTALVLALESLNSAFEGFIDLMHPGIHLEIKVIKDMAAGAVLVASGSAVVVAGAMIFATAPQRMPWLVSALGL